MVKFLEYLNAFLGPQTFLGGIIIALIPVFVTYCLSKNKKGERGENSHLEDGKLYSDRESFDEVDKYKKPISWLSFLLTFIVVCFVFAGISFFLQSGLLHTPDTNYDVANSFNSVETNVSLSNDIQTESDTEWSNMDIVVETDPDKAATVETWTTSKKVFYLGSDLSSYSNYGSITGGAYTEYDGSGSSRFYMGGIEYSSGFRKWSDFESSSSRDQDVFFNLGGSYKYLSGVAGRVDHDGSDGKYVKIEVYGDGKLLGSIEIKRGGLPVEFSYNVSGVHELRFSSVTHTCGVQCGFGNVCLYNNLSDKPNVYKMPAKKKTCMLGEDLSSYSNYKSISGGMYSEYDGSGSSRFYMGGIEYSSGFRKYCDATSTPFYSHVQDACFNLGGNYEYLSGVAGRIDNDSIEDITIEVYGDGKLLGTMEFKSGSLPVNFNFNVSGVHELRFASTSYSGCAQCGFGNVELR